MVRNLKPEDLKLECIRMLLEGLSEHRLLGLRPGVSDSVGLRIFFSKKFPSDVSAAHPRPQVSSVMTTDFSL